MKLKFVLDFYPILDCAQAYIGLALTGLALMISVCLNVLLYSLRRRDQKTRDAEEYLYDNSEHSENRFEEEVQQQENPIYGNICTNGGESEAANEMCYEPMTGRDPTPNERPADVSYASLDLRNAKKHKKKRKYQQNQTAQTQKAQFHATLPQGCLDVAEGEEDVTLPSRSSSLMVSRHSIYLNSQQITQEAQELGNAQGHTEEW
ncbi:uncharacterized protein LOC125290966 isoform X1 [Alosa alosa]|uniref:uncharacterized protein LOC125290966 isoform X1 n=1 Tax=Alosa alosa TaxID=278164 RepID=UPI002015295D|nr:uncharacterized protein LOC125290966 isoform X1 [Alosa alosa]